MFKSKSRKAGRAIMKKDLKMPEKAFGSAKGARPFVRDHRDRGF